MLSLLLIAATISQPAELDASSVERFARLALECVHREYPNKIGHVMNSDEDARPPRELTPAFYGCYDWHSSVHGHWLLARLLRMFPDGAFASEARAALDRTLTPDNIADEAGYISAEGRETFERPYGLAWLLQLDTELSEWEDDDASRWSATLAPLVEAAVERLSAWLPKLDYPIRTGVHPQTAFSFGLAHDWAVAREAAEFRRLLESRMDVYYATDRGCPIAYEPSGHDFLSPCLGEADLMRRVAATRSIRTLAARAAPDDSGGRLGRVARAGRRERPLGPPYRSSGRPEPEPCVDARRDRVGPVGGGSAPCVARRCGRPPSRSGTGRRDPRALRGGTLAGDLRRLPGDRARAARSSLTRAGRPEPSDWLREFESGADSILRDLRELVEIESPSRDAESISAAADWIVARLARSGVEAETVECGVSGAGVLARIGPERPGTLLLGHHDTVWPVGTLAEIPFRIAEDRITGPGCFDMKAGLAIALATLEALARLEDPPPVTLFSVPDEEIGSDGSRARTVDIAKRHERVLVLEPSQDGAVKVARKGTGLFHLTFRGRAAHAGLAPQDGASALAELARAVPAITALEDRDRGTTVTPTVASAGTTTNVVPELATLSVDTRTWDADESRRVENAIRTLRAQDGRVTIQVEGGFDRLPLVPTPESERIYARAREIARALGRELASARVGGGSDGNLTSAAGVPTLDGLGPRGLGRTPATSTSWLPTFRFGQRS